MLAKGGQTALLPQKHLSGGWSGPVSLDFKTTTVVSTAKVMADPNPMSTPIPVSEQARAAD